MTEPQIQATRPSGTDHGGVPLPWGDYDDDMRDGILSLVRDTLGALLVDIEAWVPDGVQIVADKGFELRISWQLASVDARVLRIRADVDAEEQRRIDELRQELGGG